ncbi:hypothetical protein [Phenylobacterium sp. J367]|uniref:hypothetical protein n=1 Tax=Phenylobacterium sp. J367 TaxID=2898435 RepID=UPI002151B07B|nr:hypothetical protein [Phenylobacterium sp. J367]MCR5877960.1 hypothetical protein [Phenylobacterium sp. J367]
MKKILLSMAAVAALGATAIPAAAQPWRGDDHRGHDRYEGQRFTGRYDALEWQINNAARERRISGSEARQLLSIWRDAQPPGVARRERPGQRLGTSASHERHEPHRDHAPAVATLQPLRRSLRQRLRPRLAPIAPKAPACGRPAAGGEPRPTKTTPLSRKD